MDRGNLESHYGLRPTLPGCDHCYALTLARRLKAMGNPKYQNDGLPPKSGPGFGIPRTPMHCYFPIVGVNRDEYSSIR